MRWLLCGCGAAELRRVPRAWWMRALFPARRHYVCGRCNARLLLPFQAVVGASLEPRRMHERAARMARAAGGVLAAGALLAVLAVVALRWADRAAPPATGSGPAQVAGVAPCHRVHIYQAGETLETIAARELGAEWHARDLEVLNRALLDRLLLEDRGLTPGTPIELPARCNGG